METCTRMIEKRGSLLLIPVLGSNRDKSTSIGPGWWLQPGLIVSVPVGATNRDN